MIAVSAEKFRPTKEDQERVKRKPGEILLSGDGIFATRQGEGATAGLKAVFVRTHLCNLACGQQGGWKCDTDYTWNRQTPAYWQEPRSVAPTQLAGEIESQWQAKWGEAANTKKRVVFTGGEPLLQQKTIAEVVKLLPEYQVEFETNGTLTPIPEIAKAQFNCSPKLANSGNPEWRRLRPEVLVAIARLPNSYFKFVVTDPIDFREIDILAAGAQMPPGRVLIMPEGRNPEDIRQKALEYADLAAQRGYRVTRRYHLEWYGDKRRT